MEIVVAEENEGGVVPADYNDIMFFLEKWSPRSWEDYLDIPYSVKQKMQEYSQAQAEGQKAKSKKSQKN